MDDDGLRYAEARLIASADTAAAVQRAYAEVAAEIRGLISERNEARARAEKAESERDEARAVVTGITDLVADYHRSAAPDPHQSSR